jgi:hypothetical protein
MASINHRVNIKAPTGAVYEVISTLGGLRSWWSTGVHGNPEKGGALRIDFDEERSTNLTVLKTNRNRAVAWTVASSNFPEGKDWNKTTVCFDLSEGADRGTEVSFKHDGWKDGAPSLALSSKRWGVALQSLAGLCETGKGKPEIPKKKNAKKATGWFPVS